MEIFVILQHRSTLRRRVTRLNILRIRNELAERKDVYDMNTHILRFLNVRTRALMEAVLNFFLSICLLISSRVGTVFRKISVGFFRKHVGLTMFFFNKIKNGFYFCALYK